MDFTILLSFIRLEVLVGLSAVVTIITQLVREAPIEWTTDKGKQIAFIVSAIVVALIGYNEGTDLAIMAPIVPVMAWISMGLYDTCKKIYLWAKAKLAR